MDLRRPGFNFLLSLIEDVLYYIYSVLDNQLQTLILLDFSKAFNTVSHR